MQVPSTKTVLDTHKELKDLRLVINGLKSEKEEVELRTKEAKVALIDVENRAGELNNQIKNLSELSTNIIREVKESIEIAFGLIRESRVIVNGYLVEIKNLDQRVINLKAEVEKIIKESEESHQKNVKDNEKLEATRKDLNVYKKRLEKIISENNLNINIIL